MNSVIRTLSVFAFVLLSIGTAFAGEGEILVNLQSVYVIQSSFGGHQAGNLEVKVLNGFSLPAGVGCDGTYITTPRSGDPDGKIFALVTIAVTKQRSISLHITDNPAYAGFAGRCSILGAGLQ